jgi:hypothetical protein
VHWARRVTIRPRKGGSHYLHTHAHTHTTSQDQRAIDVDSRSNRHSNNKSESHSLLSPPALHVVRCDFDPFLDRERRDVTDPMPAPCISSCCNAANRSALSAARRLFGPGPWRWYRDCLNLGRISSCPPPTRSYSLGRECFKAGRIPHKKISVW